MHASYTLNTLLSRSVWSAAIRSLKKSTLIRCANLARPSRTGDNSGECPTVFNTRKYVTNTNLRISVCCVKRSRKNDQNYALKVVLWMNVCQKTTWGCYKTNNTYYWPLKTRKDGWVAISHCFNKTPLKILALISDFGLSSEQWLYMYS